MPQIKAIGKYLDQPILMAKINKNVPYALLAGSGMILANTIYSTPPQKRKKSFIKTSIILLSTAISAIYAPKIAAKITQRQSSKSLEQIMDFNKKTVDKFIEENKITPKLEKILQKSKTKILSLKEVDEIFSNKKTQKIAQKIIPPPENIKAKDIFKEIGWLSIYGAIPVIGGIAGGISADKLTEKNWKKRIPNKIKEGIYQYLANIFLCNIGAGAALGILEKLNIKSKVARCIGMTTGIITTGIISGSIIANYIGNKIFKPFNKEANKELRTPELIDLTLHTDDIATVSLLSGLKWIEPSLPLLYSISGYRAGIGYRNDKHNTNNKTADADKTFLHADL